MINSILIGLFLGGILGYFHATSKSIQCDGDIIDIYYPPTTTIKELNLEEMLCPYILNPCENCEIAYISRKHYDESKKWYNAHGMDYPWPKRKLNF